MTWTLFVPTSTRPFLMNQLRNTHWAEVGRKCAEYRDDTALLARHARIPHLCRVHIIARGVYADKRTLPDPAAIAYAVKACIDGLVLAGVITDDDDRYVARESYDPARRGTTTGIELTIEEAT
jgi:hypothetical protein